MTNGNLLNFITRMIRIRIGDRKRIEKYGRSLFKRNSVL